MNNNLKEYHVNNIENLFDLKKANIKLEVIIEYSDFMIDTIEVANKHILENVINRINYNSINSIRYILN